MNSPCVASHTILSSPAIDPRVLDGRGLVVRQALPKSDRAGKQEDYENSDSDDGDISDAVHDSPSWSASGGHREGSFKKRPPPTPCGTPMAGVDQSRSFISASAVASKMATVEITPGHSSMFKAVGGNERKKRLSGLTALSDSK